MKYYIEFDFRHEGRDDQRDLLAQIMVGVHMAIVQECGEEEVVSQSKLGVSFPYADSGPLAHGGAIRVFSDDKDVLGRFLRSAHMHRYARVLEAQVRETPEAKAHAVYFRERKLDSYGRKGVRPGAPRRRQQLDPGMFTFQVRSFSTRQDFWMTARTWKVEEPVRAGAFSSYGLTSREREPVSLPIF